MAKICWMQISDIHLGYRSYTSLAAANRLGKYIASVVKERKEKPRFLFLTGDFVYAPAKKTNWADEALDHTREILNQAHIEVKDVYLVPGNHDISNRDENARIDILEGVYRDYNPNMGIITPDRIQYMLESFSKYKEFYNKLYQMDSAIDIAKRQWSSENIHKVITLRDFNILLLNTGIFYDKKHESGSMILGTYHLEKVLSQIDNNLPIVILGHHPIDSFRADEANRIKGIFSAYNVIFYLCGHGHIISINKSTNKVYEVMAPTSMNRDERDKSPCQIGFLIGEFDTEILEGSIEAHFYDPFSNMWDKYRQVGGQQNESVDDRINGIYRIK